MNAVNVAILGATGAVGKTLVQVLEEREFPVDKLFLLASERSAGEMIEFKGRSIEVEDAAQFDFSKVQIGLFSAGSSLSAKYAPLAAEAGCIVIDNTSHFRCDNDVPLVIPEVNPEALHTIPRRIIANPNCSTIQMLMALKPIYDAVGITRINVATYQAVSGTGKAAIAELIEQTGKMLNGMPPEAEVYPVPIAFNAIPHIDDFMENGYTREEMKMVNETRKIFADDDILVNPTAVRIPVVYGHSEALHIETRDKITAEYARELLAKAPGVVVKDKRAAKGYPTPMTGVVGQDAVYVGRIREDISCDRGLNLWVVADNVRKGAASNAVQIAELLLKDHANLLI